MKYTCVRKISGSQCCWQESSSRTKPREGSDVKCLTFELARTFGGFSTGSCYKRFCVIVLKSERWPTFLTECFAIYSDDNWNIQLKHQQSVFDFKFAKKDHLAVYTPLYIWNVMWRCFPSAYIHLVSYNPGHLWFTNNTHKICFFRSFVHSPSPLSV